MLSIISMQLSDFYYYYSIQLNELCNHHCSLVLGNFYHPTKFPCAHWQSIRIFILSPKQSLVWFPTQYIWIFWSLFINEIMGYIASWAWLLSLSIMVLGFIHVVTCICSLFFSVAKHYSIVWRICLICNFTN